MNSVEFILGFAVGFFIVIIVALGVFLIVRKKCGPSKYDERQQLIRGNAYKASFWVLTAYLLLNGLLQVATGIEWADLMTSSFIGVCIAITVFVVLCIRNDAYFPVNVRPKFYVVLFLVFAGVDLALGLFNLSVSDSPLLTDGKLNYHIMSFVVAAMFLAVLAAILVRSVKAKKNGEQR